MMTDIKSFLFLLFRIATLHQLLFYVVNGDCTIANTENPHETDFLKRLSPLKNAQFKVTKEYDYYLGVCTDADVPSLPKDSFAGLVQVNKTSKVAVIIGQYNETQLMGGDGWILLRYKHGKHYSHSCDKKMREAQIMITCGPQLYGEFTALEENKDEGEDCYYLFQLESSVACTRQDGLSAGSIFCIVTLTGVGLYLLIGFLHQRIVVGAKGLEQIPNYSMWKEFGKLQADGCDLLCRCGERQEAKMYRGIDDQLLNPEARDERDDRLLPM